MITDEWSGGHSAEHPNDIFETKKKMIPAVNLIAYQ